MIGYYDVVNRIHLTRHRNQLRLLAFEGRTHFMEPVNFHKKNVDENNKYQYNNNKL
jgi:hypothetical protein